MPEFRAPITKILRWSENLLPGRYKNRNVGDSLVRRGILATTQSTRVLRATDSAAGIAEASTMGHTLGSCVGIRIHRRRRRTDRTSRGVVVMGREHGGAIRAILVFSCCSSLLRLTPECLKRRRGRQVWKPWGVFGHGLTLTPFLLESLRLLLTLPRQFPVSQGFRGSRATQEAKRWASGALFAGLRGGRAVVVGFVDGRKALVGSTSGRGRPGRGCHVDSLLSGRNE